jgi:hypothetical protein
MHGEHNVKLKRSISLMHTVFYCIVRYILKANPAFNVSNKSQMEPYWTKVTKEAERWNNVMWCCEHLKLFMSKMPRNVTPAAYISLQFVETDKQVCTFSHCVGKYWNQNLRIRWRHITTLYSHSNLAYAHAAFVPSFVLLLFSIVPTDGAQIKRKERLVACVVQFWYMYIYTYNIYVHEISCLLFEY